MKIVIDVPEKVYNHFCRGCRFFDEVEEAIIAITDGTLLPKGHGRLIDADKLNPDSDYEDGIFYAVSIGQIGGAETVVEAESEEEQ